MTNPTEHERARGLALLRSLERPSQGLVVLLALDNPDAFAAGARSLLEQAPAAERLAVQAWEKLEQGERLSWLIEAEESEKEAFWAQVKLAPQVTVAEEFGPRAAGDDGLVLAPPGLLLAGLGLGIVALAWLDLLELLWLTESFGQVKSITWDSNVVLHQDQDKRA